MTVDCETTEMPKIDEPIATLGQRLVAASNAQGLSQADIAKEMRLSLQTVIDIESDDYSHGSAIIYLRGYLRGYARLVGLNPDEVLADFEKSDWVQTMRGKENEKLSNAPSEEGAAAGMEAFMRGPLGNSGLEDGASIRSSSSASLFDKVRLWQLCPSWQQSQPSPRMGLLAMNNSGPPRSQGLEVCPRGAQEDE